MVDTWHETECGAEEMFISGITNVYMSRRKGIQYTVTVTMYFADKLQLNFKL